MKISEGPLDLPIEALVGAIITSDDGAEIGAVADIRVDITNHEFILVLDNGSGLRWSDLKDYVITFQGAA
jgi:sporulation protein YlmC with PRC-barrel domain|tara:strand:+ start:176 stop:385 length:210 start_codon:yes stop_codon:yes gene_type:complete